MLCSNRCHGTNACNSRSFFTQQQISDFDDARDSCLGPREDRTSERSTQNTDGVWIGRTAFERNPEANQAVFRVYTLGPSFERQTSKMAPAAPGKVHGGWSKVNQMRKDLLKVRTLRIHHIIACSPGLLPTTRRHPA